MSSICANRRILMFSSDCVAFRPFFFVCVLLAVFYHVYFVAIVELWCAYLYGDSLAFDVDCVHSGFLVVLILSRKAFHFANSPICYATKRPSGWNGIIIHFRLLRRARRPAFTCKHKIVAGRFCFIAAKSKMDKS